MSSTLHKRIGVLMAVACVLRAVAAYPQSLTGALIGTVEDAHGGAIEGAAVRVQSPAMIGTPEV